MLVHVAAVAVVGLDRGNPLGLGHAFAAPTAEVTPSADWMLVTRKTYFGLGTALSNRKSVQPSLNIVSTPKLLGDRAEGRRVAAGDDAGEEVDLLGELHAAKLFDVGVGAGRLVGDDGLDLPLAQEAAFGVDLLGRQQMPFAAGLAQKIGGAGQEGDVAGLERRVGNVALGLVGRLDGSRAGEVGGRSGCRCSGTNRNSIEKRSAIDWFHRDTSQVFNSSASPCYFFGFWALAGF